MKEYWLQLNPETHIRATHEDKKSFFVFGPLARNPNRTAGEEEDLQKLIINYPHWYKRFRQLERYNDYKRRLTDEAVLKGFWLRDSGMEITFYVPVSRSWRRTQKEKMHLQPHQFKPDIDNLFKSLADTLRPQQDQAIWQLMPMKKLWINAPQGHIHIICHDELPQQDQRDPFQLKLRARYK